MDAFVILKALIALPLIFFIPGFVTFHAFKIDKVESLKLTLFETLFLQVLASMVITGWIAFTLAEVGYFSLWLLCGLLLAYSLVMAIIFRDRFRTFTFPRPSWNLQSVFLILLAVLAGFLFFHPSEEIILRHDIGTYINTGVNIAETGSIVIHDPILAAMPDSARDIFYSISADPSPWSEGAQFPDFPIVDRESGTIIPWRLPLQQVWFAIFYAIFSLKGALYSQPLFGLLGVLSVFLVGKTIWNWRVGAIASSFLAVNFAQVFFSQYTSPEILFQLLAFAGIATFILFIRTHNGFFGIVAAMSFGELFMTRLDALLIFIPIVLIVLYIMLSGEQRKKVYLYFIVPFLVLWFHSLAHIYSFSMSYIDAMSRNIKAVQGIGITPTLAMASLLGISVIVAAALLSAASYRVKGARLSMLRKKLAKKVYVSRFLMFIIALLLAYLWLTSPSREPSLLVANLILIPRDFDPTVALSWFVGWLGLGLALFGLFSMLYRRLYADSYLFLGIISLSMLAYLYTLANNPVFPWAMRRMIPIVLPAIMILIGYGMERTRDLLVGTVSLKSGRALLGRLTMILLVLTIVVSSAAMWHTLLKPQFEGFVQQVDEVADFFPADSIILDNSRFTDVTLSAPLKYIYGKNAIYLHSDPENADQFAEMVRLWEHEGRDVYLIVWPEKRFDSITSKLSKTIEFRYETTFLLEVSKVEWETRMFSNTRVEREYPLKVYRVIPL